MFNDSIETSAAGCFKVIYTGNADLTADGVLFTLDFDVAANAADSHSITLSYVQADTFKEGWTDVVLNCESIGIMINSDEPTTEPETTEPTTVVDPPVEPAKKLSDRINDWYNSMPVTVKVLLFAIVKPLAFLISLFELIIGFVLILIKS